MRFPIKGKDIIELSIEECEINAILESFEELFNKEFESIEFYSRNHIENKDYVRKKIYYNESGFIHRIEFYKPSSGKPNAITYFEKSKCEIISKKQLEYGFAEEIWKFNSNGNIISFQSEYGSNYLFKYDENENLESVSEGFKFKWKNGGISELINETDNSLIKKISRKKQEVIVESPSRKNKNISGITTYKYDDFGRLIRIESTSGKRLTEINYELKNGLKLQTSISSFNQEQTSFSRIIEKSLTENKVEVEFQFQQSKNSPIMKSKIVQNKRKKTVPNKAYNGNQPYAG